MDDTRRNSVEKVCSLLDRFGIDDDLDWLAVLLFVRNLAPKLSVYDKEQKAEIQNQVIGVLRKGAFNKNSFKTVHSHLEAFVQKNRSARELAEALAREKNNTQSLLSEMNRFLFELKGIQQNQESSLDQFGVKTIEVVENQEELQDTVGQIRSMLDDFVEDFKEENQAIMERTKALERTANFDALLTNLHNRRALDIHLKAAVEKSNSTGNELTFMMIDVDHFKRVNDSYGHQIGDEVLKALAKIIEAHCVLCRGYGARYGGEELVIMVEGVTPRDAATRAEALRIDVEHHEFRGSEEFVENPLKFTVSIGVSNMEAGWTVKDLVGAADKALYNAKESGRNMVLSNATTV